MEKNTTEQLNAPLGVATNVPLHYNCLQCNHFCYGFEFPFCCYLECEISNPTEKNNCLHFELFKPLEDLPF